MYGTSSGGSYTSTNQTLTLNTSTTPQTVNPPTSVVKNQPGITFKYGTNTWYMVLQPAMDPVLPMQGSRGAPGAAAGGIVVKAKPLIARHVIPGFGPIIQHLGVYSTIVSFVGAFVGYEGTNQNNISEFYTYPSSVNWQSNSNLSSAIVVDSYGAFTTFWNGVVKSGYQLQVTIATNTILNGSSFKENSLRDSTGQPNFIGYISKMEAMYVRDDLTWYNIDIEVVDQPNAIPVQLPACKNSSISSNDVNNVSNSICSTDPSLGEKALRCYLDQCKAVKLATLASDLVVDGDPKSPYQKAVYSVFLILDTSKRTLPKPNSGRFGGSIVNSIWLRNVGDGSIYTSDSIDIAYIKSLFVNVLDDDMTNLINYRNNENRIILTYENSSIKINFDFTYLNQQTSGINSSGNLTISNSYEMTTSIFNNNFININIDNNFYNFTSYLTYTSYNYLKLVSSDAQLLGLSSCVINNSDIKLLNQGLPVDSKTSANPTTTALNPNTCPDALKNSGYCTAVFAGSYTFYVAGSCSATGRIYDSSGNIVSLRGNLSPTSNVDPLNYSKNQAENFSSAILGGFVSALGRAVSGSSNEFLIANYFQIKSDNNDLNSYPGLQVLALFDAKSSDPGKIQAHPYIVVTGNNPGKFYDGYGIGATTIYNVLVYTDGKGQYYKYKSDSNNNITLDTGQAYQFKTDPNSGQTGLYQI